MFTLYHTEGSWCLIHRHSIWNYEAHGRIRPSEQCRGQKKKKTETFYQIKTIRRCC